MTPKELKEKYIKFFLERGHKEIPSASLVPENDPSTLFISAGMHPLVPFLLGEAHPAGKRLVSVQKCLRTEDIDRVGNNYYHTFFEMLGNWSLGDYFKKEMIPWSYEFLTKELGIDPSKLNITVFAGDENSPKDEESAEIWQKVGIPNERIFNLGKEDNWWGPVGKTGPCGPDTEMYIDTGKERCGKDCKPGCHCGKYIEFWNDVFMQYNKKEDGSLEPLEHTNVDTGMGVDRTSAILEGHMDDYKTENFLPIIHKIESLTGNKYGEDEEITRCIRIIADHIRSAVFVLSEGVIPSNKDRGYILRRLIRRVVRFGKKLSIDKDFTSDIAKEVIQIYEKDYPEISQNKEIILSELQKEEHKFSSTLDRGAKEFEKIATKEAQGKIVTAEEAFNLYQSFGFPIEITEELASEIGFSVDTDGFEKLLKTHQEKSREGLENKFVGGLSDHSEISTKYHTATHLLQSSLRKVLGEHVSQKGSNITGERLRFDFSHPEKVTDEQLKEVEKLVNSWINSNFPIEQEVMTLEAAKKLGSLAFFGEKYGDQVKVYTIKNPKTNEVVSKEVCGGPHVKNTSEIGEIKIIKEEGVGEGVRRIKAIVS